MSIEVGMEHYRIIAGSSRERYIWTDGLGDCIAIAAQTEDEMLFAHFTSHQYLAKNHGGKDHDNATSAVKNFVVAARNLSIDNVLWVINYPHEPGTLHAIGLKLGLPKSQLRVAGREGYTPITLDMPLFQLYRSRPEHVNDQANISASRYDFPADRSGASNNARRNTKSCCTIL